MLSRPYNKGRRITLLRRWTDLGPKLDLMLKGKQSLVDPGVDISVHPKVILDSVVQVLKVGDRLNQ